MQERHLSKTLQNRIYPNLEQTYNELLLLDMSRHIHHVMMIMNSTQTLMSVRLLVLTCTGAVLSFDKPRRTIAVETASCVKAAAVNSTH